MGIKKYENAMKISTSIPDELLTNTIFYSKDRTDIRTSLDNWQR